MKKLISLSLSICLILSTLLIVAVPVSAADNFASYAKPDYTGYTFGETLFSKDVAHIDAENSKLSTDYWDVGTAVTNYDASTGAFTVGAVRVLDNLEGALDWSNYVFETDIIPSGIHSTRLNGISFYASERLNGYAFAFNYKTAYLYELSQSTNGTAVTTPIVSYTFPTALNATTKTQNHNISVVVYNGVINCYFNGELIITKSIDGLADAHTKGAVGIVVGGSATYSNYTVRKITDYVETYFADDFNDGAKNPIWSTLSREGTTYGKAGEAKEEATRFCCANYTDDSTTLVNYTVEADLSYSTNGGATANAGFVSLIARSSNASQAVDYIQFGIGMVERDTDTPKMVWMFRECSNKQNLQYKTVNMDELKTNTVAVADDGTKTITEFNEYHCKITVMDNKAYCFIDGVLVYVATLTANEESGELNLPYGYAGFYNQNAWGCIDNFKVTAEQAVKVTGVELDKATTEIGIDETLELTATVAPENATYKDIAWVSSDEEIATVENGVVTGISKGEVIITAKSKENGAIADRVEITVLGDGYVPEFTDSFDSFNSDAWSTTNPVENGVLVLAKENNASRITALSKVEGSTTWTDYSVSSKLAYTGYDATVTSTSGGVYVTARATEVGGSKDMVGFGIGVKNRNVAEGTQTMTLIFREYVNGEQTIRFIPYEGELLANTEYDVTLTVIGNMAYCIFEGELVYKTEISVTNGFAGLVALMCQGTADDYVVAPATEAPAFVGGDLDGDGNVTIADLAFLRATILGSATKEVSANRNFNLDDEIDARDIVALKKYIANMA